MVFSSCPCSYYLSTVITINAFRVLFFPFPFNLEIGVDLYMNVIVSFFTLQEALDIVHVSKEDQESVFKMLTAVLWLGNVSFTVIDNENHVEPVADEGNNLPKR
ncbi:hypothetical protein ACSBR1_017524 [Camellia fascicularis]